MPSEGVGKVLDALMQTWPGRLAHTAYQAVTLPGDVYQGNVSMYGEDGHTNPEVINRSADLGGLLTLGAGAVPAETNSLRMGVKYPTDIDPTQTAWLFKDVKAPHPLMGKSDWRKVTNATNTGDGVLNVELPIRSMNATQKTVNPDFMKAAGRNPTDTPFVIKKNGQYFVQDGHHRITQAAVSGEQTAPVRLFDLDGTTQTNFPLIDFINGIK